LSSILAVFGSDLITSLPGTGFVTFNQYAGYVSLDAAGERNTFYWLTESQRNPTADPLVLWLSGGPGCSSLVALFQELGPFTVNADGSTLSRNPYSWNTIANILFVDAPIGTGFSYSTSTINLQNDTTTAADLYTFLQGFFARYPALLNNPFWLAGEGYAAHILPFVVNNILSGSLSINFNGIILGNAYTDLNINNYAEIQYAYSANFVSDDLQNELNKNCDFLHGNGFTPVCHNLIVLWREQVRDINYYDPYNDICLNPDNEFPYDKREVSSESKSMLRSAASQRIFQAPCIDNYITSYLNLATVKAAIHANPNVNFLTCSVATNYDGLDEESSMLSIIYNQLQSGIRYMFYSGDNDLYTPTLATRIMINGFNLTTTYPWHEWVDSNNQIGGYTQSYATSGYGLLYFITVKGAAHYVPVNEPVKALDMITRYLEGVPF